MTCETRVCPFHNVALEEITEERFTGGLHNEYTQTTEVLGHECPVCMIDLAAAEAAAQEAEVLA